MIILLGVYVPPLSSVEKGAYCTVVGRYVGMYLDNLLPHRNLRTTVLILIKPGWNIIVVCDL